MDVDVEVRLECLRLASTLAEVTNAPAMVEAAERMLDFLRAGVEPTELRGAVRGTA